MSSLGRADVYQFAISSGSQFTQEADARMLTPPPGNGWELVRVQFTTDYLTVWRRQRKHPAAVKEAEEKRSVVEKAPATCRECGGPAAPLPDGTLACSVCGLIVVVDKETLEE